MASCIMHICISNLIKQKYDYSYDFLLGAMMPDILKKNGEDKNKTHYRTNNDYTLYEIDKYAKEKNLKNEKKDLELGYLSHLIEDKILAKYINTKIKEIKIDGCEYITYLFDNNSLHKKSEFITMIHNEYAIIDDYVLKKYNINLDYISKRILRANKDEKLEKIIQNELQEHEINEEINLKILPIDYIQKYIMECVNEYDRYLIEEL